MSGISLSRFFWLLKSAHRLMGLSAPLSRKCEHLCQCSTLRNISNGGPFIENKVKHENAITRQNKSLVDDESAVNDLEDVSLTSYDSNYNILNPNGKVPLETFAPYISPTFNFAAYVNKSPTLQELVKLGVNLYVWEKKKGIAEYVLKLDFERDMKPVIRFLHDKGVHADNLGTLLTKNPLIFREEIEDLEVRINYLESKRFTSEMIGRIISGNPYWLVFSTQRIDRRLGHFQKTFHLSGDDIRMLSTKLPRLITYNMNHIKGVTFAIKEMMGFDDREMKQILLLRPKLWMLNQDTLIQRFNYIHNEMGVPHEQLAKNPAILQSRLHRIQQRHKFLDQYVAKSPDGKSRYDPKSIGYVSLNSLTTGNDAEFCCNVAKVSVESFNAFLKSL